MATSQRVSESPMTQSRSSNCYVWGHPGTSTGPPKAGRMEQTQCLCGLPNFCKEKFKFRAP